ncbi:MAG: hypothetical protein WC966_08620 [Bradymonadales bacterium]
MPDNTNAPEQHETRGITADNLQMPELPRAQPSTASHNNGFTLDNIQLPKPTPEPAQEDK